MQIISGSAGAAEGVVGTVGVDPAVGAVTAAGVGNGVVNVDDLLSVMTHWGACVCPADVNHDGVVNVNDLLAVMQNWGP